MDIVFPCDHCGRKLVGDSSAEGEIVVCPACGEPTVIPAPITISAGPSRTPSSARRVVHIPKSHPKNSGPSPASPEAAHASTMSTPASASRPPARPARRADDPQYIEIVVGWICVVVGTLLAVLMPRAYLVYAPFFLGAVIMAILLFAGAKAAHALVLLLCTCIPAPLLTRQSIWKNLHPSAASQAARPSGGPKKLVFDAGGKTKLVEDEPQPYRPPAEPAALPPVRATTRPAKKAEPPPPQPARPSDPFAEDAARAAGGAPPADDPYAALLANTEEIPPLVPEDVLAATRPGRPEGFRWQDESVVMLAPDDPAPLAAMPFVVYSDHGGQPPYSLSGRIGNDKALQADESWDVEPHAGKTCIRVSFTDPLDWVTAAWQNPPGNYGDLPGGYNVSKATKLTFWAKGEKGGEKVEFMAGMEQGINAVCRDSLRVSTGIVRLSNKWKKFSLPIDKEDRSRLITGFLFRIEGQNEPVVFYLDDIQFE